MILAHHEFSPDMPMQDDYPQTPDTIAAAREETRKERIRNGLDPETGMTIERMIAQQIRRFADPGTVVAFVPRPEPLKMPEPANANERVAQMQLKESADADVVAEWIADVAYGVTHLHQLDRREASACRYLATHALRRLKDYWNRAAERAAVKACAESLRTECGAAFRDLSDRHAESVAAILTSRVLTAYHGVTEGTATMTPAEYIEITKGKQ